MLDKASGVNITNVVRLLKRKRLSEEDVVEKVISVAKEFYPALSGVETSPTSELEQLILNLPEEFVMDLVNNDSNAVNSLKTVTQLPCLPEYLRTRYLSMGLSVVPVDLLGKNYETVAEFDDSVDNYKTKLNMGFEHFIDLMIENGNLPNKNLIDHFIHHGVREADKFIVLGSRYINRGNLKFAIDSVYETFKDKRKLRLLTDVTEIEIERECVQPIKELISYFFELEDCRARRHKQIEEIKRNRIKDLLDGNKGTGNSGVN